MNNPVVIVGAGLSGLRAASLLTAQGIECRVLEARDRIGGRVLSTADPNRPDLGKFDLGPTWFWPQYESTITNLIKEQNLGTFVQYTKGEMLSERFPNEPPERYILPENSGARSIRFIGGVQSLIDAVAGTLPPGIVELETRVTAIRLDKAGAITLEADLADGKRKKVSASAVILALPPRIVARHIEFSPALPPNLMTDLVNKPTWMAGQAKAVAIYDRPFWRESGLSGFVSSWVGPLQEIHDASPPTGSGALFGFFGMPVKMRRELGEDKVLKLVIDQLVRLFGPSAKNVSSILYKDWSRDSETAIEEDFNPLRDYPSYGQPPKAEVWEKKIIFAGTETNSQYGGHLEGALQAAEQAVFEISNLTNRSL
ncbi:FAD-dependent oxidoreductase [Peribacillus simplex]|uniref:FAD-dependent oxidoreductase n=2 Tax=Peribacillus TaxID=2675229 RepID=A0AA90PEE4_9BACI|nr:MULTISPECIES: FAD-dependent oxidoreductase [Peribacillus]MDP1419751.1 FAD-dependent oxidoreductase [Peribacillus simplex]MDP1452991.1 FAD-dependent oxidoreductase [Peribacillus frigoritolerans]